MPGVRSSRSVRGFCLILLAAWLSPTAAALAMSAHLSLHHGADDDDHPADHRDHASEIAELAALAEISGHGHSHGLSESPHNHAATPRQSAPALAHAGGAPVQLGTLSLLPGVQVAALPGAPPPAAPRLLFSLHCALLR